MNKETFLKELESNLKYLTKEAKTEELKKFQNLTDYNLDPIEQANIIYQNRGINYHVNKKISLFDSVNILINEARENKNKLTSTILFLIYAFILIILIKIPFIYIRELGSSIFNNLFSNQIVYTIWNLLFELLYAITAIFIFIKLIKNKAITIKTANKRETNETE